MCGKCKWNTITVYLLEYANRYSQHSLPLMSSGGSADVLRSPRTVVWRKRPGRGQKLHLSRCGRVSHRLHGHICRQSWQLPDPTSWLCANVPVERSDLQRPLLSGRTHPTPLFYSNGKCMLLPLTFALYNSNVFFRCTSRHREPPVLVYPSAEMNILMLLWY